MSTPGELRTQLATSDFFKQISAADYASDDFVQIITVSSCTMYGINQKDNSIISLGLNGRQTPTKLCAGPIHCIDAVFL